VNVLSLVTKGGRMAICTLLRTLQEEIKIHRYFIGGSWGDAIADWQKRGHFRNFLVAHQENLLKKSDKCENCQFNGKCDFSKTKKEFPSVRGPKSRLYAFLAQTGIPEPSEKVLKSS